MKSSFAKAIGSLALAFLVWGSGSGSWAQMSGSTSSAPTLNTANAGGSTPSPQQFMAAVAQGRRQVQVHPDDAAAWLNLGKALQSAGALSEAGEAFDKALELDPKLSEAWSGKGQLEAQEEKWWLAAKDFRQAVLNRPNDASAHFLLGQMLLRVGDFKEAAAEFSVVLHRDPQMCCYCVGPDKETDCGKVALFCYVGLGQTLMQHGNWAAAEKRFRQALAMNHNYPAALISEGQILLRKNEPAKASKAFETVLRLRPDSLPAINGLATAWRESSKPELARQEFSKARELFRRKELQLRAEDENNRGLDLWRQGDLPAAAQTFRRALADAPDYAPALDNLGSVLSLMGDDEGAVKEFAAAVSARPNYAEAHDNWGIVLLRAGNIDGAIDQFRAALATRPGDSIAHLNLGVALERKGQTKKAESELRLAVELAPEMAKAHVELGLLLASRHARLTPDARAQIAEGLRLAPELRNLLPKKIAAEFP